MLRYFRINDPYRLVGLLFIALIIYLPLFIDPAAITKPELKSILVGEKIHNGSQMYTEIADNTAPLAAWTHALLDIFFGQSLLARHIVAFVIIFLQGAYLGIMFITKKVHTESTFIPSFLFCLLFAFSFDTLALSDELFGSGFLLLALNNIFKEIEFRNQRDETTFNLGLYISLASLFHFPYLIFVFAVLVILFLFARATARKFLLFLFGFLFPHLLVLSISYVNGSASEVWAYYYSNSLSFGAYFLVSWKGMLILGILPVVYLLISIFMLNRLARFSKYQSEILQCIFLWIGFCFIYFLFCQELRPQTLIVLIPPISFLFTHFLLLIRRKRFAEMNTLILFVGIILFSYLARYDKLGGVNYDRLVVLRPSPNLPTNKKILVLGDSLEAYMNNSPATPFINWRIAKDIFEQPEYYESITSVYHGFKIDPPEIVIDQSNLMKPFLERIPELKRSYTRRGNSYVRTSSN